MKGEYNIFVSWLKAAFTNFIKMCECNRESSEEREKSEKLS